MLPRKKSSSAVPPREDLNDLGFGSKLTRATGQRLLNRDGSFNVEREGLSLIRATSPYHRMLTIPWSQFHLLIILFFVVFNGTFAAAYLLCGEGALRGALGTTPLERFLDAFFFSVQTSTTIGYGHMSPVGLATNIVVSLEVMTGLMGFALATSLVFARFSRPIARIIFSENAIIAPYRGITALEFRMINARSNQLIQLEIKVLLSRMETHDGILIRRFHELSLERSQVMFFPLNWTVVHPIDKSSPLHGVTREEFLEGDPEIMILLTGIDETFSQTVHARSSYKGEEIVWGAKFSDMYQRSEGGVISVDLQRLHAFQPAELS